MYSNYKYLCFLFLSSLSLSLVSFCLCCTRAIVKRCCSASGTVRTVTVALSVSSIPGCVCNPFFGHVIWARERKREREPTACVEWHYASALMGCCVLGLPLHYELRIILLHLTVGVRLVVRLLLWNYTQNMWIFFFCLAVFWHLLPPVTLSDVLPDPHTKKKCDCE